MKNQTCFKFNFTYGTYIVRVFLSKVETIGLFRDSFSVTHPLCCLEKLNFERSSQRYMDGRRLQMFKKLSGELYLLMLE